MITHRQIALALVALFMASCNGTSELHPLRPQKRPISKVR